MCKGCNEVGWKIWNLSLSYERSVQEWGNNLLLNLWIHALKRLYLLSDGNGEKRECPGCEWPMIKLATFLRAIGEQIRFYNNPVVSWLLLLRAVYFYFKFTYFYWKSSAFGLWSRNLTWSFMPNLHCWYLLIMLQFLSILFSPFFLFQGHAYQYSVLHNSTLNSMSL